MNYLYNIQSEFVSILVYLLVCFALTLILIFLSFLFVLKTKLTNKSLPYECGFDMFVSGQGLLDIRFYVVAILFLIFDVEIAIIYPWVVSLEFLGSIGFLGVLLFFFLLTLGFIYELIKKFLDWASINVNLNNSAVFLKEIFLVGLITEDSTLWEVIVLLPEIFLCLASIIAGFWGLFVCRKGNANSKEKLMKVSKFMCCIFFFCSFLGLLSGYYFIKYYWESDLVCLGGFIYNSYLTIFIKTLFLFMSGTALLGFKNFIFSTKKRVAEFPAVLGFLNLFLIFFFTSNNLASFVMSLEGASLLLYVLCFLNMDAKKSGEAAMKYFSLGAIASGILLLGLAVVYAGVKSSDFTIISSYNNNKVKAPWNEIVHQIGATCILFGLFFKLAIYPNYKWAPEVVQGVPYPIVVFVSVIGKFAFFFGTIKMLAILNLSINNNDLISLVFYISIIGSLGLGALNALRQASIKGLLAFASINQMGLVLMSISLGTTMGYRAGISHLVVYSIASLVFFLVLLMISNKSSGGELLFIKSLNNLGYYNKSVALILTFLLLVMGGVPPTIGFLTKFQILLAVYGSGNYLLLLVGLLFNIISLIYYLRVIRDMWLAKDVISGKKEDLKLLFVFNNKDKLYNSILHSMVFLLIGLVLVFGHYTNCFEDVVIDYLLKNLRLN